MARRSHLAPWIACVLLACGKDDAGEPAKSEPPATTVDLDKRCVQLAKFCGDKGKHVDKITDSCKQAAKSQLEKGCAEKAVVAYDCYETELCARTDKVWSMDDLGVLVDRHRKCVTERDALRACAGK